MAKDAEDAESRLTMSAGFERTAIDPPSMDMGEVARQIARAIWRLSNGVRKKIVEVINEERSSHPSNTKVAVTISPLARGWRAKGKSATVTSVRISKIVFEDWNFQKEKLTGHWYPVAERER